MHEKVGNSHRITTGKNYGGEATLRRPTHKLENNIKMYLQDVWRDRVGSGFTRSKERTENKYRHISKLNR